MHRGNKEMPITFLNMLSLRMAVCSGVKLTKEDVTLESPPGVPWVR